MKPLVLPASTTLAAFAGALSILLLEVLKHFGIEFSILAQQAMAVVITVLAGHFTVDSPPAPVAREAVEAASDKIDAAEARAAVAHAESQEPKA